MKKSLILALVGCAVLITASYADINLSKSKTATNWLSPKHNNWYAVYKKSLKPNYLTHVRDSFQ